MKHCIIADFEWCVTPHQTGDHFQYFNEILSAGAVCIDETGQITDRFYSLICPENAAYLHPVILSSLRLDRDALAEAPDFYKVFRQFLSFCGENRIFTWGCADRSALLQNLRIKAGYSAERAGEETPQMRDIQPILSRGAGISPPYPSLAAVLSALRIKGENRHNALSDAEDTAHITALLYRKDPALTAPLFPAGKSDPDSMSADPHTEQISPVGFRTPGEALNEARRIHRICPVCRSPIGVGTWIRASKTEILTLCSCESDGRFLCTVTASPTADGTYCAHSDIQRFEGSRKEHYETARRAARIRRMQSSQTSPGNAPKAAAANSAPESATPQTDSKSEQST